MKLLKHVADQHYEEEGIVLNEKSEENNGSKDFHKEKSKDQVEKDVVNKHIKNKGKADKDKVFVFRESNLDKLEA